MNELLCEVNYHFENVPKFMQGFISREFMRNRGTMVDIFNDQIDVINRMWDHSSHGEPAVFGEWDDDLNPHYVALIGSWLFPYFRKANRKCPVVKYRIDYKNADIVGYVPWLKGSKIWITIKLVGEEES